MFRTWVSSYTSTGIDADASKGETSPGYFNRKLVYWYKCGILISARATPFLQHRTVWDGTLSGFPHHGIFFPGKFSEISLAHDDVIKWEHFLHYWPFVRRIHRWPMNSPQKTSDGDLMFSLICAWMKGWVNNREAGDLRRYCAHNDVTLMIISYFPSRSIING